MKTLIIVVIAFLAVVYVYAYRTHKKRKNQTQNIDSISDFKKKYENTLIAGKPIKTDTLDYIERSTLIEEAKAAQQSRSSYSFRASEQRTSRKDR